MQTQLTQPASFSIADVVRGMFRRWMLMGFCIGLGILAGLAILALNEPQYATEARVIIANMDTPYDRATNVQDTRAEPFNERFVLSQVSVLESGDLSRRVLKSLDLVGKGEFEPLRNSMGSVKKLLLSMGFGTDPRLMSKEERAVYHLQKKLTVYQIPQSYVIGVKYEAADGKTAADVANAIAETYVMSTRENQSGTTTRAREWLGAQIELLRAKVSASEAAVEKFRAEAGLLKGQTTTLGAQEISELNSQITLAEASASEAAARADEIVAMLESQGSVDAAADVLNSPTIQRLREQQVTAQQRLSQLSATYLPNHPKMIAASRDVSSIERQLRKEALKIVDSLQSQAKVAQARADSLRRSLDKSKTREGGALQSEVKLQQLQREASADRALLESMLARFADANARQDLSVQPGYARVIQQASVPGAPFFPKAGPTLVLTFLAGLGLALGLAFLLEIIAQSGRVAEAANANVQPPPRHGGHVASAVAVQVPELGVNLSDEQIAAVLRATMAAQPQQASPVAEPMPQVLASLPTAPPLIKAFVLLDDIDKDVTLLEPLSRLAKGLADINAKSGTKAFGITSVGGSYDAAFIAVGLSRLLAANKAKTVVLDLVPNRPSAMDLFALQDGAGLCELATGQADVSKVILRDPKSGVQVIRYGHGDAAAKSQLSAKIPAIIASLAQVYDVILLNVGEASPSTPDLVQGAGAVVFLAAANRQRDAIAAAKTLSARGVRHTLFVKLDPAAGEHQIMKQAM